MRFHGLMLLRDEEDIIDECLTHLASWIDTLHIYDLGSTDSTWEIVQEHARRDPRIVPALYLPTVYNDNLRCVLFDRYREKFDEGDWIMKIDSDEFYEITPPHFVKHQLSSLESAIYLQWYFFRLSDREVAEYEAGKDILEDRRVPIAQRRRFYTIPRYSEPRMFRYRRSMKWHHTGAWPYHMGVAAKKRIPIRHYPHRDPIQMQKRYQLRHAMMRLTKTAGPAHWDLSDWRKDVFNVGGNNTADSRAGMGVVAGLSDDTLHEWTPGQQLPEVNFTNHLPPPHKRWLQIAASRTIISMLDSRRPGYDKSYQPPIIPDDLNRRIYPSTESQSPVAAP